MQFITCTAGRHAESSPTEFPSNGLSHNVSDAAKVTQSATSRMRTRHSSAKCGLSLPAWDDGCPLTRSDYNPHHEFRMASNSPELYDHVLPKNRRRAYNMRGTPNYCTTCIYKYNYTHHTASDAFVLFLLPLGLPRGRFPGAGCPSVGASVAIRFCCCAWPWP